MVDHGDDQIGSYGCLCLKQQPEGGSRQRLSIVSKDVIMLCKGWWFHWQALVTDYNVIATSWDTNEALKRNPTRTQLSAHRLLEKSLPYKPTGSLLEMCRPILLTEGIGH